MAMQKKSLRRIADRAPNIRLCNACNELLIWYNRTIAQKTNAIYQYQQPTHPPTIFFKVVFTSVSLYPVGVERLLKNLPPGC